MFLILKTARAKQQDSISNAFFFNSCMSFTTKWVKRKQGRIIRSPRLQIALPVFVCERLDIPKKKNLQCHWRSEVKVFELDMTCLHRTVLLLRLPQGIVSRLRMIQDPEREEGKPAASTDGRKHPGQVIWANEVVPEGRVPCCQHLLASFFFSFFPGTGLNTLSI